MFHMGYFGNQELTSFYLRDAASALLAQAPWKTRTSIWRLCGPLLALVWVCLAMIWLQLAIP
jgi:hypothetical protein